MIACSVERVGPRYASVVASLQHACFDERWDAAEIAALLAARGTEAILLRTPGCAQAPAGFAVYRVILDEAELLALGVLPALRGQGIGHVLLNSVLDRAAAAGGERLFLEVAADNVPALALYRKAGFVPVGVRKLYYSRPGSRGTDAQVLCRGLRITVSTAGDCRNSLNPAGEEECSVESPQEQPVSGAVLTQCLAKTGHIMQHDIEKLCTERGMRMTEQRRTIAQVMTEATDHPDVEELYRRASARDPKISIATVYRTVRLFEEAGILERHDFRDGRSRYEQVPDEHHDHLIDLQSGAVVEFRSEEIEELQRAIAERLGYRLVDHRLELYAVPLNKAGTK